MVASSLKIYNEFQEFLKYQYDRKHNNTKYIEGTDESEYNPNVDTFNELIETIHDGNFFNRLSYDERIDFQQMNDADLIAFNKELYEIQDGYKNGPSIIDIIKLKIPIKEKKQLLEAVYNLENCPVLSPDYNYNLKYLENTLKEASRDPD